MFRVIAGVVIGLAVWVAVISLLDRSMRYGWHDYAAVYKAMAFTLPMMIARLSESAVSSLISGYVAALVARGGWAPLVAGTIILLFFLPIHYLIWSHFPIWYHLTFLISLPLLSFVGGRFYQAEPVTA